MIVAAAALQNGATPSTELAGGASYTAPNAGQPIRNAPGVICPDTDHAAQRADGVVQHRLRPARRRELGADKLKRGRAGLRLRDGADLRPATTATLACGSPPATPAPMPEPGRQRRPGRRSPSPRIGQNDVRMTPLQGALIAATVANNGTQMRPYLVEQLLGPDLQPTRQRRRRGAAPAGHRRGGRRAARDDEQRGARTAPAARRRSTASRSAARPARRRTATAPDHGWFIGFALQGRPAGRRRSPCSWRTRAPAAAPRRPRSRARSCGRRSRPRA